MAQPPATQFSGIFISYRRDDSSADARHLRAELVHHFGKDRVFRDRETIEAGEDFIEVTKRNVDSCEVLIAIIGRRWLSTVDGTRRLDDPNDLVRREIAGAINRGIRVIPVLVQGATVPRTEDLPDEIAELTHRQAHPLRDDHDGWKYDVDKLISVIEKFFAKREEEERQLREEETRRLETEENLRLAAEGARKRAEEEERHQREAEKEGERRHLEKEEQARREAAQVRAKAEEGKRVGITKRVVQAVRPHVSAAKWPRKNLLRLTVFGVLIVAVLIAIAFAWRQRALQNNRAVQVPQTISEPLAPTPPGSNENARSNTSPRPTAGVSPSANPTVGNASTASVAVANPTPRSPSTPIPTRDPSRVEGLGIEPALTADWPRSAPRALNPNPDAEILLSAATGKARTPDEIAKIVRGELKTTTTGAFSEILGKRKVFVDVKGEIGERITARLREYSGVQIVLTAEAAEFALQYSERTRRGHGRKSHTVTRGTLKITIRDPVEHVPRIIWEHEDTDGGFFKWGEAFDKLTKRFISELKKLRGEK